MSRFSGASSRTTGEFFPKSLLMKTRTTFTLIGILSAVGALVFVPQIVPSRTETSQNACVGNLLYITRVKESWAKKTHSSPNVTPTRADLFGLDQADWPSCPAGGT